MRRPFGPRLLGRGLASRGVHAVSSMWDRYWFGPELPLSHAICRIAVAASLWMVLHSGWKVNFEKCFSEASPTTYRPIGLMMLFGDSQPSESFLRACIAIAEVTCWTAMFGLLSRISMILCSVSMTLLLSYTWSFNFGIWCNGANTPLIAGLAVMFAVSSPMSVDWLFGRSRSSVGHRWPVLLGQFAVAMMFSNAAFWKLYQPGVPLGTWALSDTLRNYLVLQYWVIREPMPGWLAWALEHGWSSRGLAMGNMIAQLLPLLACFVVRWPWIRALGAVALVTETLMLGQVMGLHNPCWYPLAAFFIDWDRLIGWARRRLGRSETSSAPNEPITPSPMRWKGIVSIWALIVVLGYSFVAFGHKTQRRYTYPFTAWPMYCAVFADPPYREHRPRTVFGTTWTVDASPDVPQKDLDWTWRGNWCWWGRSWDDTCDLLKRVRAGYEADGQRKVSRIVLELTTHQIQAFPDNRILPVRSAVACCLTESGPVGLEGRQVYDPKRQKYELKIVAHGMKAPRYEVGWHPDYVGEWAPLPIESVGDRLYLDRPLPPGSFMVVRVRDESLGEATMPFAISLLP